MFLREAQSSLDSETATLNLLLSDLKASCCANTVEARLFGFTCSSSEKIIPMNKLNLWFFRNSLSLSTALWTRACLTPPNICEGSTFSFNRFDITRINNNSVTHLFPYVSVTYCFCWDALSGRSCLKVKIRCIYLYKDRDFGET